ncbi:MAG TPA: feruloyl-CoA synthase [Burkholderiales bacterium]|nr:feruloyl-CoA synthase [Burkholderiales bacterium]
MRATPVRRVPVGAPDVLLERRADGSTLLRSPEPLAAFPGKLTERFAHWAREAPDRIFIAERDPNGAWRKVSYGEAFARFRAIAQALLDRKLTAERPVVILSDNDVEQALVALAALHVGIPFAPVSSAYSLVSTDFEKLRYVVELLTPGLVFAADAVKFGKAIGAVVPAATEVVVTRGELPGRSATPFAALEAARATDAVDRAHAAVGPDSIAKFLLTSGSTGHPKAVINTQRMLCSNIQMIAQTLPFVLDPPPVLVDWLPWNHTFGGNHNFSLVVYGGGTLYIDDGKPVPGLIEKTVRNLREIAPTVYFNVPRGFEELVPYLRREPALREKLFSRVGMLFYAGAGLSQPVWDAMDELAVQACGERILWVTGLGATETAPSVTFTRGDGVRSGMIGLPVPGVEVKLVPDGDKAEMRVRGPSVTPGYWRQPDLTRAAFDDEGFYRLGDAVAWVDERDPRKGLVFDGRVAEDFKLATGTWVSVGPLRARFIAAAAPFVQDVVIAGLNRDWIGALVFPRLDECRALAPELAASAPAAAVLAHPAVRGKFQALLDAFAREATGSSTRIARAILLDAPPSIDASEITDKGSINQRAVLKARAAPVEELYAETPPPRVIVAGGESR